MFVLGRRHWHVAARQTEAGHDVTVYTQKPSAYKRDNPIAGTR